MRVIASAGVMSFMFGAAIALSACDVIVQPSPTGNLSAPSATAAPTVDPVPAQSPTPDPTATPSPIVFATPAPIVAPTPAPTAAPVPTTSVAAWAGNEDCASAIFHLGEDAVWDHQTSVGLANGSLTTYPASDAAVYAMWSQRWYTLLGEVYTACPDSNAVGPSSVAPSYAQITEADAWMTQAIGNHQYDAQHVPGDASWDAQWTAIYTALIAEWNALVVA